MANRHRALPPIPGQRPAAPTRGDTGSVDKGPTSVDFFLPTGIMITLPIDPSSNLRDIKSLLFREARKYPLFSLLKDHGFYNFLGQKEPASPEC